MKYIFTTILLFFSTCILAQSELECKFNEMKFSDGSNRKTISIPTKLGKLILSKYKDTLTISYNTKGYSQVFDEVINRVYLRIDSTQLIFSDNTSLFVKSYGNGLVENNLGLKPQFRSVNLVLVIPPKELEMIAGKTLAYLKTKGEKEAEGLDAVVASEYNNIQIAFRCFNNLK